MKTCRSIVFALATLSFTVAAPQEPDMSAEKSNKANEFTSGGCRDVIFIYARGSLETGNLGPILGPQLGNGLKNAFGSDKVAVEGVDYKAYISTNFLPGGADPNGVQLMRTLVLDAIYFCPESAIVVGGYSQGAAIVHRALESLPEWDQERVNGAITFGDTQFAQDGGRIPNFPVERTMIFCNKGDLVCKGKLQVLAPHYPGQYKKSVPDAVDFLVKRINAKK